MRRRRLIESFGTAVAVVAAGLFAVPAVADEHGSVEVLASDFEEGLGPWGPRGDATLDLVATDRGTSLQVSNRTASWNGAAVDAAALLAPGETYDLSAWVRLAPGEAPTSVALTVEEKGAADAWTQVAQAADVGPDGWVELAGSYTLPDGLTEATLYVEAGGTTSFQLDDVLVTGPGSGSGGDALVDSDFEETLAPWSARGPATVTLSDAVARSGTRSALVADRTQAWHGLGTDVTGLVPEGTTFSVQAWVRMAEGAAPADVRLSLQRDVAGQDTAYDTLTTVAGVTADGWSEVTATLAMPRADSALLYLETTSSLDAFHVDDAVVTRASTEVQTDIPSLQDVLPWPIGVAIDERETTGAGAQLVTKHFDQITAENDMKPEAIQPEEGVFTFEAADRLVDAAVAAGQRVYGHTLVWHSQTPGWFFERPDGTPLTSSPEDQELLRERMVTHIRTVADHFRDRYGEYGTPGNPIVAFDVVNEAIAESEADGLRRSPWFQVLGEEYLDLAFRTADEAFGDGVTLFLNDYNTELPAKRQAMLDVATRLLDRGVPVDGLGHQFHVSLVQPVAQMRASIEAFATTGLVQAVTELDVQIDGTVTSERLTQQGYYYADVFDMLREFPDLLCVTVWGPYDSRSWRTGAPLLFDDDLQAKPAYWGIVDRDQLPALTQQLAVHEADVDPAEGPDALEWALLPDRPVGEGTFQVRWHPEGLTALVEVPDATDDGAGDTVDVFAAGTQVTVTRADAVSTADGWAVVVPVPVPGLARGDVVPFDLRVTDGSTGAQASWNDLSHGQEDGERLGRLTLVEPVGYVEVPESPAPVVVDGVVEDAWADAPVLRTDVQVEGTGGATGDVRVLWEGTRLAVLVEVTDPVLDDSSSNAWEQDSVEVFLDPDNAKAGAFRPEDGQYRVSYTGAESVSGDLAVIGERMTSATQVVDGGYVVEATFELGRTAQVGDLVGLDVQVNDAAEGVRSAVHTWTDPTGRSYQDTSRWGVARFVAGAEEPVLDPRVDADLLVTAGASAEVELSGWAPGSEVVLTARPVAGRTVPLGTVTVDADGGAVVDVDVPRGTRPGAYVVTAASGDLTARDHVVVLPPGLGALLRWLLPWLHG